jgi:hypothetical protein
VIVGIFEENRKTFEENRKIVIVGIFDGCGD